MGGIWSTNAGFAGEFSEVVGYKAGLALTRNQLHEHLIDCPDYSGIFHKKSEGPVRLRSEVVQALAAWVLWRVGYLSKPTFGGLTIDQYHKYKHDKDLLKIHHKVTKMFVDWLPGAVEAANPDDGLNPVPFARAAEKAHGIIGLGMALELIYALDHELKANPFTQNRYTKWKDRLALHELFDSESLEVMHGKFIDQRFIDYLAANKVALDTMHWRKFEGLAASFFEKLGYHVEIGPGRNDDGVDIRVWRATAGPTDGPPLVLVQCKRQKAKIEKVVVKALWADVVHEKAQAGLIVTTSRPSPGAKNVASSREYPVKAAERPTLELWLNAMRTPGTGVFLAE